MNEDKRKKELGLSDEELAFYDILARHKDAIKEYDLIKELVKKVLRGKVQVAELNKILSEVIEQAEGQYKEWQWWGEELLRNK